jgi:hypothetical protein
MDNAGNCNGTARELRIHIPHFLGMLWWTRCFPHIVNLIAKMFLSFFWKAYVRKKVVKVGKGTKRQRGAQAVIAEVQTAVEDVVVQEGDDLMPEEEEIAAAIEDENAEVPLDNGQQVHDEKVVQTLKLQAIADMARRNIKIAPEENAVVTGIFPKVAGLARRLHDNSTLGEKFTLLAQASPDVVGNQTSLTRRVPTRWNSEKDCLDSHINLRPAVESLTGNSRT